MGTESSRSKRNGAVNRPSRPTQTRCFESSLRSSRRTACAPCWLTSGTEHWLVAAEPPTRRRRTGISGSGVDDATRYAPASTACSRLHTASVRARLNDTASRMRHGVTSHARELTSAFLAIRKLHGGASTGSKPSEGRERVRLANVERWRRWRETQTWSRGRCPRGLGFLATTGDPPGA
jgi:hypothetical protein